MRLTVELTPAQEIRLREDAARAGVDLAALLLERAGLNEAHDNVPTKAVESVRVPERLSGNDQEWQKEADRFRQWADSHRQKGSGLSLDAMSRESIYGEHG